MKCTLGYSIQDGSVSAPVTETTYRVKYFEPISKEIIQDTSTDTSKSRIFFHFTMFIHTVLFDAVTHRYQQRKHILLQKYY